MGAVMAGDAELLAGCYRCSIELADLRGLKSIAFPSISTGAFGYPINEASRIALRTMKDLAQSGKTALEQVVFVTFSASDYRTYQEAYREIFADSAADRESAQGAIDGIAEAEGSRSHWL